MTIKGRIEKRAMKLVDWEDVKFHTDEIENFIGKMAEYHQDYTGELQDSICEIRKILEEAREKAMEEIMEERDKEEE